MTLYERNRCFFSPPIKIPRIELTRDKSLRILQYIMIARKYILCTNSGSPVCCTRSCHSSPIPPPHIPYNPENRLPGTGKDPGGAGNDPDPAWRDDTCGGCVLHEPHYRKDGVGSHARAVFRRSAIEILANTLCGAVHRSRVSCAYSGSSTDNRMEWMFGRGSG